MHWEGLWIQGALRGLKAAWKIWDWAEISRMDNKNLLILISNYKGFSFEI